MCVRVRVRAVVRVDRPFQTVCPTCRNNVVTYVSYRFGGCAIVTMIIFFILFWPLMFMVWHFHSFPMTISVFLLGRSVSPCSQLVVPRPSRTLLCLCLCRSRFAARHLSRTLCILALPAALSSASSLAVVDECAVWSTAPRDYL